MGPVGGTKPSVASPTFGQPGVDVLSDVLRAVRLTGAIFFDVKARAPWVAATPEAISIGRKVMPQSEHVIMFHAVTSGGCWAELLDGSTPPTRLESGDIIVLPLGDAHVLCSEPGMRTEANLDLYRRPTDRSLPIVVSAIEAGGAEHAHFVCGYLGCDARDLSIRYCARCPVCWSRVQWTGWVA